MRREERSKTITFPVFSDYSVEIVVAKDVIKARHKRDSIYGIFEGNFHALHSHNRLGKSLIVFPDNYKGISDIAHECCHAVQALMEWTSINDTECMAYIFGYLTQVVYDFVRVKNK